MNFSGGGVICEWGLRTPVCIYTYEHAVVINTQLLQYCNGTSLKGQNSHADVTDDIQTLSNPWNGIIWNALRSWQLYLTFDVITNRLWHVISVRGLRLTLAVIHCSATATRTATFWNLNFIKLSWQLGLNYRDNSQQFCRCPTCMRRTKCRRVTLRTLSQLSKSRSFSLSSSALNSSEHESSIARYALKQSILYSVG